VVVQIFEKADLVLCFSFFVLSWFCFSIFLVSNGWQVCSFLTRGVLLVLHLCVSLFVTIFNFVHEHLLHFTKSVLVTVSRVIALCMHHWHARTLALLVGAPGRNFGSQRNLHETVTLATHLARVVVVDGHICNVFARENTTVMCVLTGTAHSLEGARLTILMRYLSKQPRHEWVTQRIVGSLSHLWLNLEFRFLFSLAKGKFQKHACSPLLSCLLLKNVLEKVFVSLNESLRVSLSVLDLLFSVSLDAFHKWLHC